MVSRTCVCFGCRGDQSPSSQQSKQWELQTAVLSLLELISVAYPLFDCMGRISFYTFHPPQDNTCGFRKASTTGGDSDPYLQLGEGRVALMGLVDYLAKALLGAS